MSLNDVTWDSDVATIENATGELLPTISLRYNAAISALEVRVLRTDADEYQRKLGRGPLCMRLQHSAIHQAEKHVIHFEDARVAFPVEVESGGCVLSVFVLRGLRVESISEKR